MLNCHCDDCKKRNGTVFSTYLVIDENHLHVVDDSNSLTAYCNEAGDEKHFCANCGSPLYNRNSRYPGLFMLFYGVVADHARVVPRFNIYRERMAGWANELGNMRGFEKAIER